MPDGSLIANAVEGNAAEAIDQGKSCCFRSVFLSGQADIASHRARTANLRAPLTGISCSLTQNCCNCTGREVNCKAKKTWAPRSPAIAVEKPDSATPSSPCPRHPELQRLLEQTLADAERKVQYAAMDSAYSDGCLMAASPAGTTEAVVAGRAQTFSLRRRSSGFFRIIRRSK